MPTSNAYGFDSHSHRAGHERADGPDHIQREANTENHGDCGPVQHALASFLGGTTSSLTLPMADGHADASDVVLASAFSEPHLELDDPVGFIHDVPYNMPDAWRIGDSASHPRSFANERCRARGSVTDQAKRAPRCERLP